MALKWNKAYEVLHIVKLWTRNKDPLKSFHGEGYTLKNNSKTMTK
jgi:hypothetical protein